MERMSKYTPKKTMDVITYPCLNPNSSVLVNVNKKRSVNKTNGCFSSVIISATCIYKNLLFTHSHTNLGTPHYKTQDADTDI